jgi:hypothetical protein
MTDDGQQSAITVVQAAAYVPISLELLRGPSAAEQAESAAWAETARAEERAARDRYTAIMAGTRGLLRSILELHSPVDDGCWWVCKGCDANGCDGEPPVWPCATARLALDTPAAPAGDMGRADHGAECGHPGDVCPKADG